MEVTLNDIRRDCRDYTQPYRYLISILMTSFNKETMKELLETSEFASSDGNVWDSIVEDIRKSSHASIATKFGNTKGNVGVDVTYDGVRYKYDIQHYLEDKYLREFKVGSDTVKAWIHPTDVHAGNKKVLVVVKDSTNSDIYPFSFIPLEANLDYVNPVPNLGWVDFHSLSTYSNFLLNMGSECEKSEVYRVLQIIEGFNLLDTTSDAPIFMMEDNEVYEKIVSVYLDLVSSPCSALLHKYPSGTRYPSLNAAARVLHYFYSAKL